MIAPGCLVDTNPLGASKINVETICLSIDYQIIQFAVVFLLAYAFAQHPMPLNINLRLLTPSNDKY